MKNKLTDLNDHLFAQLERLGDEGLSEADIAKEAARAKAIVSVADKVVENSRTMLSAARLVSDHGHLPSVPLFGMDLEK